MSNYFEERQAKAVARAVAKIERVAEKEAKKFNEKTALNLIELEKLTLEEIAKCTGLTLRRVQTLAKKL